MVGNNDKQNDDFKNVLHSSSGELSYDTVFQFFFH